MVISAHGHFATVATTAVVILAAGAGLCIPAPADPANSEYPQRPRDRFRTSTEVVSVDVLVLQNRKAVAGLRKQDFTITDNGREQTIDHIWQDSLACDVLFVVDTSGSVTAAKTAQLIAAMEESAASLRTGDRAALIGFSDRVRVLSPWTTNMRSLAQALAAVKPQGRTRMRDAVITATIMAERPPRRTLIVLFSDGADTASWVPRDRLLTALRVSDVVLYPLAVPAGPTAAGALSFLSDLAARTGGRLSEVSSVRDIRHTVVRVLDEYRQRYVIAYSPDDPRPGWHAIDVSVARRGATVVARRGYFRD
jgi:VWFA-related protein